jgi:mono/diheme cytochrome c family protein
VLKPLFVVPALLLFALPPQQPAAPAALPAAAAAQSAAPAPQATVPAAQAVIPAEAARMVNPIRPTPDSQVHAKKVYGYDCAMCHGENGNGKGELVADMKLTLKDYSDPTALKGMTDGELFYVIKNGQGQMPGEGDRAKPEDIWNMVILVRSFAKK